ARPLGFLLLRLRVGAALRLGVGTEVAIARWRGCARIEPWRAEPAAGSRAAEAAATRTAGPRSTKTAAGARSTKATAAGTRAAKAAAGARATGAAVLTSARFADRERASVEHLSVESLNRVFRVRAVLELDEREPARAAGFTVDGQDNLRGRRDGAEI